MGKNSKELRDEYNSQSSYLKPSEQASRIMGNTYSTKGLSSAQYRENYYKKNGIYNNYLSSLKPSEQIASIIGVDLQDKFKKEKKAQEEYLKSHPGARKQNPATTAMTNEMISSKRSWYKPADMEQANKDLYGSNDPNSAYNQAKNVYAGYTTKEAAQNAQKASSAASKNLEQAAKIYATYNDPVAKAYSKDLYNAADNYDQVSKDMGNAADIYGYYKTEDAYNAAVREQELKDKYAGLSFEDIQKEKAKLDPASDEYKFLENYGVKQGYQTESDYDKDIASRAVTEDDKVYATWNKLSDSYSYDDVKRIIDANNNNDLDSLWDDFDEDQVGEVISAYQFQGMDVEEQAFHDAKDLERAKNQYHQEHTFDRYYNSVVANSDYPILSQYGSEKSAADVNISAKDVLNNNDLKKVYEYINTNPDKIDELWTFGFAADYKEKGYAFATKEEKEVFNYLYNSKDFSKAYAYLDEMEPIWTQRREQYADSVLSDYYDKANLGEKALINFGASGLNIAGGIQSGANMIDSIVSGKDYNPYAALGQASRLSAAIRKETGEEIAKNTSWEIAGRNVGQFAYNTIASTLDSATGVALLGPGYAAVASGNVFNQTAEQMIGKGYSQTEIWLTAGSAAIAEALFEKYSIDNLVKIPKATSFSSAVKATLKQGGIEASEEVFTEISNLITDSVFRAGTSDLSQMYSEYIKRGYTEEEAKIEVEKEVIARITEAGLGGFFSGFAMGGFQSATGVYNSKQLGKNINNVTAQTMIDTSLVSNNVSKEAKDIAEKYNNNVEAMSDGDRALLYSELLDAQSEEIKEVIKNETGITDKKVIDQVSNLITEDISEEDFQKKAENIKGISAEEITKVKDDLLSGAIETPISDTVNNARVQISVEASKQKTETMSKRQVKKNDAAMQETMQKYEANLNTSSDRAKYEGLKGTAKVKDNITNQDAYINKFESVDGLEKSTVISEGGKVIPLSTITFADEKLGKLYSEAASVKSTALANAILENYTGQDNVSGYVQAANVAYVAGRMDARLPGKTFENFYANKENAEVILSIGDTMEGTKAFLQRAYSLGQNEALKEAKKAPKQKTASFKKQENAENILESDSKLKTAAAAISTALEEKINFVSTIENNTGKLDNQVFGSFDNGIVNISDNTSNEWNTIIHEAVMEKMKAENPDGYKSVVKAVYDYMIEAKGQKYLQEQLIQYQDAYTKAEGKETSIENIFDEYVNDFVAGIFSTDKGVKDFAKWVTNDRKTQAHSIFSGILDLFDRIVNEIKSYLSIHKNMNLAAREGLRADKLHAQHIRDLVMDIMDEEGIAVESTVNAEDEEEAKHSVEVNDSNEDKNNYKEIAKKAEKHFGVTYKFDLAGYIDVNGKLLDFSDGQKYRVQDHREISEILDLPDDAGYSDGLIEFMRQGNIRLQSYGIDIAVKPNKAQRSVLRDFFNKLDGEVTVDYSRLNGDSAGSADYTEGTSSSRILNDIDKFFDTGEVPEGTYDGNTYYSVEVNGREVDNLSDVLSIEQHRKFMEEIDNNPKSKYQRSANGDYIVPIDNMLVYTDFNKTDPGISSIIVLNYDDYSDIDAITQFIYDIEKGDESDVSREILENMFGKEYFKEYNIGMFEPNKRYDRQAKRGKMRSDAYHSEQQRKRANFHFEDEIGENDISKKYSVEVDSKDRNLMDGQIEFFKDAKTRDDQGRLKTYYHGTSTPGFTVFDKKKARSGGTYGGGFYFSDSESHAGQYGDRYEVYLNITDPLKPGTNNFTDSQVKAFIQALADDEDYGIENYGYSATVDSIAKSMKGKEDWAIMLDLNTTCVGDMVAAIKLFNEVNGTNYDGIIAPTETVAFYPEQIKNVTNENPTSNPDIRLSVNVPGLSVDTIGLEVWDEIMQEEELKTAQSIIEEGAKTLKDIALDEKKIDRIAANILKTNKSTYSKADLSQSLKAIFAYMTDTADVNYDVLLQVMKEVAKPVLEKSQSTDAAQTYDYERVKQYLKGTVIALSPSQKKEVAYNYGSYDAFRRRIFGSAKIGDNGTLLDTVWSELVDISGGRLSISESDVNQPQALLEMIDDLKPHAFNEYGMDMEHAAYDVALDIYRSYFELQDEAKNNQKVKESVQKLIDKQKAYRAKSEKRYKEALQEYKDQLKSERNKNISEIVEAIKSLDAEKIDALKENNDVAAAIIEAEKKAMEKKLEKVKMQNEQKIADLKAKNAQSKENQRAKAQNTKLRQFVQSQVDDLNKMLKSPNKDAHIKNTLIRPTIEVLESIDVDTGKSKGLKEKLDRLRDMYDSYKSDSNFDFDYDENTAAMIRELQILFTGRNITQLTNNELDQVLEIVKRLKRQIKNANQILQNEKLKEAKDATAGIVREIRNSSGTNNSFTRALDNYADLHLNAKRWARKVSGYKDGYFMALFDQLDKGQMKKISVERHVNEMFSPVLDGKENQKNVKNLISADKKDLVDVGLVKMGTDKKALITKEMRLSILMHAQNNSNMRHVLMGGMTVPDMELYAKGKFKEAFDKGDTYHFVEFTDKIRQAAMEAAKFGKPELVDMALKDASKKLYRDLYDSLSDYEKSFLKISEQLFHDYTGDQINKVSNELKGYSLAAVRNYFPIKTDPDFTKIEFAGLIRDGSIEGQGFLKSRVKASNQILLEGITNVILRQTDNVSRYVGLAIPVRNVNMLVAQNVYNDNKADSIKAALRKKWGHKNVEWFQNLIQDVQGGRKGDSSVFDTLRSRFAGATLTLNPSVAIKQAASYPTAAAVVGWGPLTKALKDTGKGFIKQKGLAELEKINPLLWYRNKGNSTQELGDIREKSDFGSKLPMFLNWIQWMDTGTVRTLEYASKYYVDSQFKNIEKGSIEYWEKVSEVFTRVVEETQPNYTVMQQADIIRNPNKFVKQIFMFKTQPLQNFGIVYDAAGEYVAKMKDKNISAEEKKAAGKKLALALSSQLTAAAVFSGMTILAGLLMHKHYKYQKEDENQLDADIILRSWLEGMRDTFLGAFIFGSETYSIYETIFNGERYYGIDVSTLDTINSFVENITYMQSALRKFENAKTDADKELYQTKVIKYGINIIGNAGTVAGMPVNNIINDYKAIYLYVKDAVTGAPAGSSTWLDTSNIESQINRIVDAFEAGNDAEYERLKNQMIEASTAEDPEKSVNTKIKSNIKERYLSGETSEEATIEMLKKLGMDENEIFFELEKWENGGNSDYVELYNLVDSYIESGSSDRAELVKVCKDYTDHGKEKSSIASSITTRYKPMYLEATGAEKAKIKSILLTVYQSLGYTRKEAEDRIKKWK